MATSETYAAGAAAAPKPFITAERVVYLLLFIGLVALPFFSKGFFVFQMTKLLIYAIAIIGLNLLTGINGQFSLGHGAFYAVGAYTTAIMVEMMGVNYMLTLPVAGLICFVFGFLFGLPALRLDGIYLALATFALAIAMPQFLKLSTIEHLTGGVQGVIVFSETFDPEVPFGLPLDPGVWTYLFTLFVGVFLFWLARNIVASRTGRAMMAIRDNPIAARSMGVNIALYKTLAFGLSALFTGVAGALSAIAVKFVAPDSFTFALSIVLLVGLVVGGVGWLPGALIGAAFIVFVPNFAEEISKGLSGAVFGFFLILVIYLAPQGAGGLLRAGVGRVKRLLGGR